MQSRLVRMIGSVCWAALIGLIAVDVSAEERVEPLREWTGRFQQAEPLIKEVPECGYIASPARWETLWKAWRGGEPLPAVDFKKQLILVGTQAGAGNSIGGSFTVDDGGDLQGGFVATRMGGPGFVYAMLLISRDGVKTYQGQAIAADGGRLLPRAPDVPRGDPLLPGAVPGVAAAGDAVVSSDALQSPDDIAVGPGASSFEDALRAHGGGDAAVPVRPLAFKPSEDDFFIRFGGQNKLTIFETAAAMETLLGKEAAKDLASRVDFGKERVALVSWTTGGPPEGVLKHEFEGEGGEQRLVFYVQGPRGVQFRGMRALIAADFFAVPKGVAVSFDPEERF